MTMVTTAGINLLPVMSFEANLSTEIVQDLWLMIFSPTPTHLPSSLLLPPSSSLSPSLPGFYPPHLLTPSPLPPSVKYPPKQS